MVEENKDIPVTVLVTPSEKEWMEKESSNEQRSLSNWIRTKIFKEDEKETV